MLGCEWTCPKGSSSAASVPSFPAPSWRSFFRILPGRWIFDPSIRLMRSLLQRAQQVTAYWGSLQYHFFDFQDPVSIPKIFLPPVGI